MNNDHTIEVKNVWKKFKIYQDKPVSLKERFLYRSKGVFQEKWVLQDVSFSIPKGRMVGLIGRNGSGKSTLLKVLTRILIPDKGEVKINGRISSLLELGAGFHMDFTGRENIYMNASIFGLTRKEINARLEEIITFSELSSFIDNPVRTYSSGMFMRLAFSIAIHVEPDILLIDEILAVGDNAFQKKCIRKIEEFKEQGKTIVFVSHDNGIMEKLCDELYWIHESKIVKHGKPDEVIRDYLDFLSGSEEKRMKLEADKQEIEAMNKNESTEVINTKQENKRWGNGSVEITNVDVINPIGNNKFIFKKGQQINICITYKTKTDKIEKPVFGVGIFKMDGTQCYGTNTHIDKFLIEISESGSISYNIDSLNLVQGDYYVDVACHHEDGTPYDYITKVLNFSVHSIESDQGIAYMPHNWTIAKESSDE
ncbi:sugar ABC transporter ATP-binding protein [Paenibacillus sp. FSL A5-0031]|uniref:ABC transporter ATP-binding protein n=1 Tax=Paenibacillus sp. FSL A5-0031 TaxID=1920420 RepID=UPI00096EE1F5|nr:ABC transporter ATP-binding protein [Paenibacillus sp. FSL A5-0031]OME80599.1 sugar ABC transporter ATP-binding protein [Paenibacillus sp. FSL A5-0031]